MYTTLHQLHFLHVGKMEFTDMSWYLLEIIHSTLLKKAKGRLLDLGNLPKLLKDNPVIIIQGLDAIPIDHNGMR